MTNPTLESDRRGVSEVIGAILVFGLVVMLVSLLQVQAIPNANEEVEFEHSQQVRGDFSELQVAIDEAVESGRSQSASVDIGVDYPSRLLFFNPPPTSGTLRTTEPETMRISNVRSDSDAGVFFDEMGNEVEYDTRSLVYAIGYNELVNSPTDVREPAVVYRREDGVALVSETNLVDGKEINLVAIGGQLDASGVTAEKIEAKSLSAPARTYSVRDTSGSGTKLTIQVPTQLSEPKWQELLADEMGPDGHVESATVSGGMLTVVLEENVQYTLRTAKVGLGQGVEPRQAYMSPVDDDNPNVATVEVRDKFNNPVSGVELDIKDTPDTVTTGPDGRAAYAPSSGNSVTFLEDFNEDNDFDDPLEELTVLAGGSLDPSDPTIDSASVNFDETETCDDFDTTGAINSSSILVCAGSFRPLEQVSLEFTVQDDATPQESGVDYVEIRVYDGGDNLITRTTYEAGGEATFSGRWVSPWLDADTGSTPSDPDYVEVVVVDRSGRTSATETYM